MARYAEEPVHKVTLNLFARDVAELKRRFPSGYTEEIRAIVRRWLIAQKEQG